MSKAFIATILFLGSLLAGLLTLFQDSCMGYLSCTILPALASGVNLLLYYSFLRTKKDILFWLVIIFSLFTFLVVNL